MSYPVYSYRSLFPSLSSHIHLASCSQGALASPVSKAIEYYHNSLIAKGNNWHDAMGKVEAARGKFAELIGAETDEIAVLTSVSHAVSAVAASLPCQKYMNKIVFTDIDFPTVGHIWYAQDDFKDNIICICSNNGIIQPEQYEKQITGDTLLTCIPHVSYQNGFKQDIREIANIVHQKGSLLFVDAYQSAGHIPIDVKEMEIDILAAGTRKYMLGIPGTAFLYIRKELAEQLKPRMTGWLGQQKSSAFNIHHSQFAEGARRFETGTPSFISVYAGYEALNLLLSVGIDHIHSYLNDLAQLIWHYGREKGLHIIGPKDHEYRSSLTAIYAENAGEIERILRERNIIVSARKNAVRIAPHFYNTSEEIVHAIDELAKLVNGGKF
ncbi:selenocysteine lyase/cysteine desulfurase [Scopulibacillus daqui]|uniref:Selenocysteine lyase/cysteine desulfurase n=1 Tax=Scopulibacillus daqui TaxID=1469162 RepID=A0ABS2PVJ9_9BACL|nr:aminotransferase class V-fold PLP-dependent enzyme [Scopulibacillus daqui]MBM7644084.1 selenocysteine lyase/cysteine desulfurase [Scopulibacillus daqui]